MTGVILINFGGPRTGNEIEPFLRDILKDVLPRPLKPFAGFFSRLRLPRAKRMYDAISGASPVFDWTTKQAQALEIRLNSSPSPQFKTYIAMKYGRPSIDEAIADAKKDGCEKLFPLPLFFYQSRYTDKGLNCHLHPLYIRCMIDIIKAALSDWKDIPAPQITCLFTAHSIPTCSAKDEPYVSQINESIAKIMEHFTGYNFQTAFQSAPFKFGWIGPDVKSVIRQTDMSSPRKWGSRLNTRDSRFRGNDNTNLLIVPLGFACENLETLYEIDQIYLPYAKKLGLEARRTSALNDNPIFIDLLAEMVLSNRSSTL